MKTLKKIRNNCLDLFFSRPYINDFLFSIIVVSITYFLNYRKIIDISSYSNISKIASDISTSSITIAGFVLTILTIVISFKNSIDSKNNNDKIDSDIENKSKIDLFFSSQLYFKTVKILQQSISGLIGVFALLLVIVIFDKSLSQSYKFYSLIFASVFAILIFIRCILTLKLIVKLQMSNQQ